MKRAPGVLLGAAAVAHAGPSLAAVFPPLAGALGISTRLRSADAVALTFDDGPHPEATPSVLELLATQNVKATFFLVGEQVARAPEIAAEIVAGGHEVGLHCHRHRNMLRLIPAQIRDDLSRAADAIGEATERTPGLYRPPYGIFSAAGLALVRRRMRPLLWSRWGRDWRRDATADAIARRVTRDLRGGDVILLHDSDAYSEAGCWRAMIEALPSVLDEIRGRGLRPVAVTAAEL